MNAVSPEGLLLNHHPLRQLNWWRVGGEAEHFATPKTLDELKAVWRLAWEKQWPIHLISGGSNVLVADGLLRGLTISLHELKGIEKVESGEIIHVCCWAGTPKSEVAKIFLQNRLPPAVFLTGIPGDMGAGVVMNAGIGEARTPREFCEIVEKIEVLRLDPIKGEFSHHVLSSAEIQWEYRHSSKWQPGIIIKVWVKWPNQPSADVPQQVREQTRKRVSTQPLELPNCGSVFRNPVGQKSAQLIEGCGLKGFRIGGACVSTKHANFIVNDQGATAADLRNIIEHVKKTVREQTGIELMTEVVYIENGRSA